jgi:hypothetical protein
MQYAAAHRSIIGVSGILDHPLEPVIGLGEGETRWRMTIMCVAWMKRSIIRGSVPDPTDFASLRPGYGLHLRALKKSRSSVPASLSPTAE